MKIRLAGAVIRRPMGFGLLDRPTPYEYSCTVHRGLGVGRQDQPIIFE